MRKVYLYTSCFPFDKVAESFISQEIEEAQDYDITIIPVNKRLYRREIPIGINVDRSICDRKMLQKISAIIGIFSPLIIREVYKSRKTIKYGNIKDIVKYLYAANLVYKDVRSKAENNKKVVFYSYWLSYAPIAFALFKARKGNSGHVFVSRAHGSDLYSTEVGVYYPLREFSFSQLDKIFLISNHGFRYLAACFPQFKNKMFISRLGVRDNLEHEKKTDNLSEKTIRVLSCSSVIPLKRVSLIFHSLYSFSNKHPELQIIWQHFGDGILMSELKTEVSSLDVHNLKVELAGSVTNMEILRHYKIWDYHCLINLSVSEGVPVSMMEAISSGIPILGTDVGGVKDIVVKETGRLIKSDFSQEEFNEALEYILKNHTALTKSSHAYYMENFNSTKNYRSFYDIITSEKYL